MAFDAEEASDGEAAEVIENRSAWEKIVYGLKYFYAVVLCCGDPPEAEVVQAVDHTAQVIDADRVLDKGVQLEIAELSEREENVTDSTQHWASDGEVDPSFDEPSGGSASSSGVVDRVIHEYDEGVLLQNKRRFGEWHAYKSALALAATTKYGDRAAERRLGAARRAFAKWATSEYTRNKTYVMLHSRWVFESEHVNARVVGVLHCGQLITVRAVKRLQTDRGLLLCRCHIEYANESGLTPADVGLSTAAAQTTAATRPYAENLARVAQTLRRKRHRLRLRSGWVDVADIGQGLIYAVRSSARLMYKQIPPFEFQIIDPDPRRAKRPLVGETDLRRRLWRWYNPHTHARRVAWHGRAMRTRQLLRVGDLVLFRASTSDEPQRGRIIGKNGRTLGIQCSQVYQESVDMYSAQIEPFREYIDAIELEKHVMRAFHELKSPDDDDVPIRALVDAIVQITDVAILLHSSPIPGGADFRQRDRVGYLSPVGRNQALLFLNSLPRPFLGGDARAWTAWANETAVTEPELRRLIAVYIRRDPNALAWLQRARQQATAGPRARKGLGVASPSKLARRGPSGRLLRRRSSLSLAPGASTEGHGGHAPVLEATVDKVTLDRYRILKEEGKRGVAAMELKSRHSVAVNAAAAAAVKPPKSHIPLLSGLLATSKGMSSPPETKMHDVKTGGDKSAKSSSNNGFTISVTGFCLWPEGAREPLRGTATCNSKQAARRRARRAAAAERNDKKSQSGDDVLGSGAFGNWFDEKTVDFEFSSASHGARASLYLDRDTVMSPGKKRRSTLVWPRARGTSATHADTTRMPHIIFQVSVSKSDRNDTKQSSIKSAKSDEIIGSAVLSIAQLARASRPGTMGPAVVLISQYGSGADIGFLSLRVSYEEISASQPSLLSKRATNGRTDQKMPKKQSISRAPLVPGGESNLEMDDEEASRRRLYLFESSRMIQLVPWNRLPDRVLPRCLLIESKLIGVEAAGGAPARDEWKGDLDRVAERLREAEILNFEQGEVALWHYARGGDHLRVSRGHHVIATNLRLIVLNRGRNAYCAIRYGDMSGLPVFERMADGSGDWAVRVQMDQQKLKRGGSPDAGRGTGGHPLHAKGPRYRYVEFTRIEMRGGDPRETRHQLPFLRHAWLTLAVLRGGEAAGTGIFIVRFLRACAALGRPVRVRVSLLDVFVPSQTAGYRPSKTKTPPALRATVDMVGSGAAPKRTPLIHARERVTTERSRGPRAKNVLNFSAMMGAGDVADESDVDHSRDLGSRHGFDAVGDNKVDRALRARRLALRAARARRMNRLASGKRVVARGRLDPDTAQAFDARRERFEQTLRRARARQNVAQQHERRFACEYRHFKSLDESLSWLLQMQSGLKEAANDRKYDLAQEFKTEIEKSKLSEGALRLQLEECQERCVSILRNAVPETAGPIDLINDDDFVRGLRRLNELRSSADAAFALASSQNALLETYRREEAHVKAVKEARNVVEVPELGLWLLNTRDVGRKIKKLGNAMFHARERRRAGGRAGGREYDFVESRKGVNDESISERKEQKTTTSTRLHHYVMDCSHIFSLPAGAAAIKDSGLVLKLTTKSTSVGAARVPLRALLQRCGMDAMRSGAASIWTVQCHSLAVFARIRVEATPAREHVPDTGAATDEQDFSGEWVRVLSTRDEIDMAKQVQKQCGTSIFVREVVSSASRGGTGVDGGGALTLPSLNQSLFIGVESESRVRVVYRSFFGDNWNTVFDAHGSKTQTVFLFNGTVAYKRIWWSTQHDPLQGQRRRVLFIASKLQNGAESLDQFVLSPDGQHLDHELRIRGPASSAGSNPVMLTARSRFVKEGKEMMPGLGNIVGGTTGGPRLVHITLTRITKSMKWPNSRGRRRTPRVVYVYDDQNKLHEAEVQSWDQTFALGPWFTRRPIEIWFFTKERSRDRAREALIGVARLSIDWAADGSHVVENHRVINVKGRDPRVQRLLDREDTAVVGQVHVRVQFVNENQKEGLDALDTACVRVHKRPLQVAEWTDLWQERRAAGRVSNDMTLSGHTRSSVSDAVEAAEAKMARRAASRRRRIEHLARAAAARAQRQQMRGRGPRFARE